MSSDEQNVAKVGAELLAANPAISGVYQIAIAESDEDLTLPAIVVAARHEEDTGILLAGVEMKRYSLTLEVRGIQKQDSVTDLDAAFDAIDETFHPKTPQTVPSGAHFQGIMIDVQTGSESAIVTDSRSRRRVYDVFAVDSV